MKNSEAMNWQTFKNLLLQHPDKELKFQYAENQFVDASYHITEIKQAPITSVDCGGVLNSWTEIIVQLWEPDATGQTRAMPVSKALGIVNVVENKLQLNPLGTVKIEFGNSAFDTRQMFPAELLAIGDSLVVNLRADVTQCKAIERGGSCGPSPADDCCAPTAKPKVELKNLAVAAESCCTPGGGCC